MFINLKTKVLKSVFVASSIFIFSCSGDDDGTGNNDGQDNTPISYDNYFPLTVNNNWTYDVETSDGTNTNTSTDVITVDGTSVIDGNTYYDMSMSVGSTGIMSQLMDQNLFRNESGILFMDGQFSLPLSELGGNDITVSIDDAELFNQSSTNGTVLSSIPGTTSQTISGFDLTITYTLKTVQGETITSHTTNDGTSYSNVIKSDIIVEGKVVTNIDVAGVTVPVTLLNTQDLYTITNYYAENLGLIDSDATFTYTLEDFSGFGITLPIPETANVETTQSVTNYSVTSSSN